MDIRITPYNYISMIDERGPLPGRIIRKIHKIINDRSAIIYVSSGESNDKSIRDWYFVFHIDASICYYFHFTTNEMTGIVIYKGRNMDVDAHILSCQIISREDIVRRGPIATE
jgi:hypothetical protein